MAGAIIHIIVALISAIIIHYIHFRQEFSLAIFIGNLLPDALKFGISAIVQGTFMIFAVQKDGLYNILSEITGNAGYWISSLAFVVAVAWSLYHHKNIRKKDMEEIDELYGFLIIGILTHLILDIFIQETGIWW